MARRRLPKTLRGAEPELLEAATRCERDRVIIQVGRLMGLRVSEITKLRIEDLDLPERVALIARAKGDKDRYVPIPARLVEELRRWTAGRTAGYLFPSPRGTGRPLTTRAVQYLTAAAGVRAGISKRVTPHKLRHTYATTLLDRGANLREVQELLGHASVATTEIYTYVSVDRLRGAVDRL